MGNPLTPLLAKIFLDNLEVSYSRPPHIRLPTLHVVVNTYNITCLFNGSNPQLNCLLQLLNSLHSGIKFTFEVKHKKSINFLEISIN